MSKKKQGHPPKWIIRFFRWFCDPELIEDIEGDLYENFNRSLQVNGIRKSRWYFGFQVLTLFRPGIIRSDLLKLNQAPMFLQSFKISFRQLKKHKLFSAIKIGGFAIGIAACLLIALFIKQEISYDQDYPDVNRIFRLINNEEGWGRSTALPAPTAGVIRDNFPQIEKIGRLIPYDWWNAGSNQIRRVDQKINQYEEGFVYVDQDLLNILHPDMVYGDRSRALLLPKSLVLTRRMANKYWPGQDPVGQKLIFNNNTDEIYVVGGVMEDWPKNSHLQYDFFLTLTSEEFWPGEQNNWGSWNYNIYLKVNEGVDPAELEKKLLSIRDDYLIRGMTDLQASEFRKAYHIDLQPIDEIHLYSSDVHDVIDHGDIKVIWLFGIIAFVILLMACINFVNLSTARSANRAKEVGLRKVIGSFRNSLIQQFLGESLMYSFFSFLLALILAASLLPLFNLISGKNLSFPWFSWWFIPVILVSIIIIGFIAGIYPAFYLSSFKPIQVIKGNLSRGSRSSRMRNGLVVIQFCTSIILIIGALIVHKQMHFILHSKLGFDKDQVIMLQGSNTVGEQLPELKQTLQNIPAVSHATLGNYWPVSKTKRDQNQFWNQGRKEVDQSVGAQIWRVDEDYTSTLGIRILKGRNFSKEIASDSSAIIINEAMAEAFGIQEPENQIITNPRIEYHVIGIVEDFHFESMRGNITPLCFRYSNYGEILALKLSTTDVEKSLHQIEEIWNRFSPNQPIRYTFLDDQYARMYDDVRRTERIFTVFSCLAIIVACLGLFALTAYVAETRAKEVGIRKVLGASVVSLVSLLARDFVKLVLIAFILACPIAWYLMQQWLEDFTYHIEIRWWYFLIAGVCGIFIALLTMSYQSVRTANLNPIDNIREE